MTSFLALFLKVPLDVFLTHLRACCTDVYKEKTENTINSKMVLNLGALKTFLLQSKQ